MDKEQRAHDFAIAIAASCVNPEIILDKKNQAAILDLIRIYDQAHDLMISHLKL